PGQFYKIIQVSSLGAKEKIALIEVGDTWLVVGMTQHSINTLHSMPKNSLKVASQTGSTSEAFSKMLDKLKTPQAKT
ncbi:MAG: flagellar biosynthetic protein FliO, partial [Limnobacter sp.]|nr:flagellar biosynthetic protein FliO [Limnobacter sp.]